MLAAMDYALHGLQWLLVLWGAFLVLVTVSTLQADLTALGGADASASVSGDYYVVPVWQRFHTGMVTGLIAVGLGSALFYLRRLHLSSQGAT